MTNYINIVVVVKQIEMFADMSIFCVHLFILLLGGKYENELRLLLFKIFCLINLIIWTMNKKQLKHTYRMLTFYT